MPAPFDNIVQHLFHQPSLQSVTVDELDRMAQQHPYFAAAHFLLLKKMQDIAHPEFNAQLHKTTLYFNNPLWLQFLLQPESVINFTVSEEAPFIAGAPVAAMEKPVEENKEANTNAGTDLNKDELSVQKQPESLSGTAFSEPAPEYTDVGETHNGWENDPNTPPAIEEINTIIPEEVPVEPIRQNDDTVTIGLPYTEDITEKIIHVEENVSAALVAVPIAEEHITDPFQKEVAEPVIEIAEHANSAVNRPVAETPRLRTEETIAAETPAAVTDEERPWIKINTETAAAKNDLLFEPYYTVDYFASQGIKLSKMEAESKDKLGRQLKSFTEWLKTMKKLPQVSIDNILAQNEEAKVVEDANHSIESKEVITEAMAEVFEKQGLHEKAAEVYRKLSLLNPGKSAYFAARIEVLKY